MDILTVDRLLELPAARKGARVTRAEPPGWSSVATGIAGLGMWVPPRVVPAEELADETGIPAAVLREKFGINQVRRAAADQTI